MKIVVAPLAAKDLDEAWEFIAKDSLEAAEALLVRVTNALALLGAGLVVGPEVTLRDGRKVRSWPVPPFRIYYRTLADELQVVRIYHQARRPIEQGRASQHHQDPGLRRDRGAALLRHGVPTRPVPGPGLEGAGTAAGPPGRLDRIAIVEGRVPGMCPTEYEELRKRIETKLMDGDSIIKIDNMNGRIYSSFLASVLTEEYPVFRRLGTNENVVAHNMLREVPAGSNFYLYWAFFRTYPGAEVCPAWLRASLFDRLKSGLDRLEIRTAELEQLIFDLPDSSIDVFNFSNIFDWVSTDAFAHLMRQVVRVARPGARLCYWTNVVNTKRELASAGLPGLEEDVALGERIQSASRTPGYSSCTVGRVRKPCSGLSVETTMKLGPVPGPRPEQRDAGRLIR